MEIVKLANGDLDLYQELLLRRDELQKEAEHALLRYTGIFGDITTEIFLLKIECITLKKAISYCVTMINKGEKADKNQLELVKQQSKANFQSRLDDMIKRNELAKNRKPISDFKHEEIKRIYRKIVKLLHPDTSHITQEHPELLQLFLRAVSDYKSNSYKEMKELEVLISAALDKIGRESFSVSVLDLNNKMSELEKEIHTITTTIPYIYIELLKDPEKISKQMKDFNQEKRDYLKYKDFLESELKGMTED